MALLAPPLAQASHSLLEPHAGTPDLIPYTNDAEVVDETRPPRLCGMVLNAGQDSISAVPFYVELRVDGVALNATQVQETLYAGQTVNVCFTLGEPLRRGYHRFTLVADSEGDVAESNETNNVARDRWFFVDPKPMPELRFRNFHVLPRVAVEGRHQTFAIEIQNAGRLPSVQTTVEVRDETGVLDRQVVPALTAGEVFRTAFFTQPHTRPPGHFTALALLDPGNAVEEQNERNNEAYYHYEIPPHPLPDLAVASVSVSGPMLANRGVRLEVNVTNLGSEAASRPVLRLYYGDQVLANLSKSMLAAGASAGAQFNLVLPAGRHTLRVANDPDLLIAELNESNNDHLVELTIEAPPVQATTPNLVVRSVHAMPVDPAPGELVQLSALVSNVGGGDANATSVAFYADGRLLGRKNLPALRSESATMVVLPWSTATPGDHDLRVLVDPDNAVRELDELDNNGTTQAYFVPPTPRTPPPTNGTPPQQPPANETPGVPTPPVGGTPAPPAPERARPQVSIGELSVRTYQEPGVLKGVFVAALRNPGLDPVGRMSVTFYVDDQVVAERLVGGLPPAGTGSSTSGELTIPEGRHAVKAVVKILGTDEPPVSAESSYDKAAGERGVPGPGIVLLLAAAALASAARRLRPR